MNGPSHQFPFQELSWCWSLLLHRKLAIFMGYFWQLSSSIYVAWTRCFSSAHLYVKRYHRYSINNSKLHQRRRGKLWLGIWDQCATRNQAWFFSPFDCWWSENMKQYSKRKMKVAYAYCLIDSNFKDHRPFINYYFAKMWTRRDTFWYTCAAFYYFFKSIERPCTVLLGFCT
jgi:hypothetical protein